MSSVVSLGDWQILLATASFVIIVLLIAEFRRNSVSRADFKRLEERVTQLSDGQKELLVAEQRRFLQQINTPNKDSEKTSIVTLVPQLSRAERAKEREKEAGETGGN
jgi:hypothetical protein